MNVEVREIRPTEVEAVAELTARVYADEGWSRAEYEVSLRDVASRVATATVLVAVEEDVLLGAVTVATRGGRWAERAGAGEAELRMLAVSASARGRGVGELLSQACLDRAREDGCLLVRLSSQPDMRTAHRLYGRLGFVRTPDDDWQPVPEVPLLAFALPLVPWCDQCGTTLEASGHRRCRAARELEPPRYCRHCRRRMVVQVLPTGWTARCVEHGVTTG